MRKQKKNHRCPFISSPPFHTLLISQRYNFTEFYRLHSLYEKIFLIIKQTNKKKNSLVIKSAGEKDEKAWGKKAEAQQRSDDAVALPCSRSFHVVRALVVCLFFASAAVSVDIGKHDCRGNVRVGKGSHADITQGWNARVLHKAL